MKEKILKLNKSTKIIFCILLALVAIFLSIWTYQARVLKELSETAREYEIKIEAQKQANQGLEKKKDYMNTDMFFEEIARAQLNMIKPNEMIIVNEPSEEPYDENGEETESTEATENTEEENQE